MASQAMPDYIFWLVAVVLVQSSLSFYGFLCGQQISGGEFVRRVGCWD
jgi:hypothetical protein